MSTEAETDERSKWSPWAIAAAALLVLMFGIIAIGSLRGCLFVDPLEAAKREEEAKKKEAEKKKKPDDFVIEPAIAQPAELETPLSFVKPGHWAAASQKMQANVRDFIGDWRGVVTSKNVPFAVTNTPFVIRGSRPVLLNKGRPKAIDSTFFVPHSDQDMRLTTQVEERGLGLTFSRYTTLTRMPSYQYHIVVLAKEPSRYSYIKALDSVRSPFGGENEADDMEDATHYRVVQLDATKPIPLSENPLTWTSIAYILWDEVDPGDPLTAEQERALVDWLHWGGQLIVSGPDSLDLLKGSFLEPYLPAMSGGSRTIAADDPVLAGLNDGSQEGWLVAPPVRGGELLRPTAPWSALQLDLQPGALELPNTGGLFVERQVGRGRIVVSAVQLAERDLINWRSGFQSLFNACLLRRPPRVYRAGQFGVTLAWADEDLKDRRLDARLNTRLHYAARDLGIETAYRYEDVQDDFGQMQFAWPQNNAWGQPQRLRSYRPSDAVGGIGAWNDFSATANAARESLREAAGVEVPGAGFVILCLAAYLVALVPINWLVFHTLGRVEWAWIAAPVIAVIGTVVIVERARLDIGFVRAQTEIGLLEQQPDHPRAHLSRYTALYTSLSTTYDMEYANLTALAAPFPAGADYQMLRGQGYQNVDFQRYDSVRLAGLPVSSNSTGMVHSEQMMTLDGAIGIGKSKALGEEQIENRTSFALKSACVVRRPTRDEEDEENDRNPRRRRSFEGRWIGQLLPDQSVRYSDRMEPLANVEAPFAERRLEEARLQRSEQLNLEPMFRLALNPKHMEEGEVRLVARIDEVLPGQEITPSASQVRSATLVIAHLKYAPLPPPRRDVNTKREVNPDTDEQMEDDFEFE